MSVCAAWLIYTFSIFVVTTKMAIVRKLRILAPKEIYKRCRMEWSRCKVVFWSLFYNDHCNFSYVMDTMMEPMIRFVDNYVKYLGPAFVGFLIGMMGMVITLLYLVVVPYEWHRKSWFEIGFYIIIGHWILVNVLFHYYAAYTTQPGFPPVGSIVIEVVGMCKHCIAPKPPRTHHCRVCNRCILKMDHHCPWMNQCVGHFNHRYFFFTMFFLWLGCVFIVIGMWPSFMEHYWREQGQVAPWCLMMNEKLFYAGYLCQGLDEIHSSLDKDSHGSPDLSGTTSWPALASQMGKAARTCILVVFFTSAAVVMALGPLTIWHMRLIARGETSIEQHINKQMRQRFEKEGKVYVNPYDFGVWGNVKRFLDLNGPDRSFWLHILLPSWRKPVGNGLTWESATFEIRHDLKADDIEAAKRALENGPENGEVVESLVCM